MDNAFKLAMEETSLSYRDIAVKIKRETGKVVSRNYVHQLIAEPGMCKNIGIMFKIGKIIGMSEAEIKAEWKKARKEHLQALTELKIERGLK